MKRVEIFICIFLVSLLMGCEKQSVKPLADVSMQSIDYLMVGHYGGFCYQCDAIYKIQDGKLYGANHIFISNPDSTQLTQFPNASYLLVKDLPHQIPPQLLATSSEQIGFYFPDVGLTFVEVKKDGKVQHWYIQGGSTPSYLQDFLSEISTAIIKLN